MPTSEAILVLVLAFVLNSISVKTIETQIRQTIPMADAMNFSIQFASPLKTTTLLPLKENHNHLGTLFGGSLYAACALSSYACLLMALREENLPHFEIVIVEGKIKYLRPGTGDALAEAWTGANDYKIFLESLRSQGKARIVYVAELKIGDKVLCRFEGLYQVKK